MLDIMFDIPSRDEIVKCVITDNTVNGIGAPLLFDEDGKQIQLNMSLRLKSGESDNFNLISGFFRLVMAVDCKKGFKRRFLLQTALRRSENKCM